MSLVFHSKRFWNRLDIGDFSIFTASGGSVGRNFNLDLRPARYFIHDYLATDLAFSLFRRPTVPDLRNCFSGPPLPTSHGGDSDS
jgi:hypothetical protein